MGKRRKFSAEFKRGAVEQASRTGASCAQLARELGIRDNLLTRWKREAHSAGKVVFAGTGMPRNEEVARLKRELARVQKERDFCGKRRRSLPRHRPGIPGDRTLPRCVPGSPDVPMSQGVGQWLLRLQQAPAQCASPGQCTAAWTDPGAARRQHPVQAWRLPALPHLQQPAVLHECSRPLWRQRGLRRLFRAAETRTHPPHPIPDDRRRTLGRVRIHRAIPQPKNA